MIRIAIFFILKLNLYNYNNKACFSKINYNYNEVYVETIFYNNK